MLNATHIKNISSNSIVLMQ